MIVPDSQKLFAWDELEDSPSLQTVKALLATVPDGLLLAAPCPAPAGRSPTWRRS